MNNRTEAKLTDLSGMQKAIEEILKQAWERGRKYGQNEERTTMNGVFMASPTEAIKVGEPLSNSEEITKALEKGELYERGFRDGYARCVSDNERPQGEWTISQTMDCHSDIINIYTCPFCGNKEFSAYPYCHCGAKLKGGEEE